MLQLKSILRCIDNTGAGSVEMIRVHHRGKFATIGDTITCVVKTTTKSANPNSGVRLQEPIKRGQVRHAVIVRTKRNLPREDGRYVRFDDNACVLVNKKLEPLGSRVLGAVSLDLRRRGHGKIMALAPTLL